jgi:hypothetical protein
MKQRTPTAGVWSRVAGDAIDLATLAVALAPSRRRKSVLLAMGVVAGAMALDALAARQLKRPHGAKIEGSGRRPHTFEHEGRTYHDVRSGGAQRPKRPVRSQHEPTGEQGGF